MPKRTKSGKESKSTAGGVVGAVAQDIELTVEQAEEATKKAAHKAAVALGIASDEQASGPPSKARAASAKPTTSMRSLGNKPKR
jgi:hypothetical protein